MSQKCHERRIPKKLVSAVSHKSILKSFKILRSNGIANLKTVIYKVQIQLARFLCEKDTYSILFTFATSSDVFCNFSQILFIAETKKFFVLNFCSTANRKFYKILGSDSTHCKKNVKRQRYQRFLTVPPKEDKPIVLLFPRVDSIVIIFWHRAQL